MQSKRNTAPTFTPPNNSTPVFTPPSNEASRVHGPVCYYHKDERAVATCARCNKNLCNECFDAYGVSDGEYANKALCYDCTTQLVAENVDVLSANKKKITTTFVLTLIGMVFGAVAGSEGGFVGVLIGMAIGGCLWTFLRNWVIRAWNGFKGGGFSLIGAVVGVVVGFVIEAVASVYRTIRKIIECIIYLKRTSGFIESDRSALEQMREYMEYTIVRNKNRGVDLETLMSQGSELYNNSFAQMVRSQGEERATENISRCAAMIAENGEIIRGFAA